MPPTQVTYSLILPCLNEEQAVGTVVEKARLFFESLKTNAEIIVVDNGSTDTSSAVARKAGARVVTESRIGYGNALLKGFAEAKSMIILMADADGSYEPTSFEPMIQALSNKRALVLGRRINQEHIPFLHRFMGVPILTTLLNWLTGQQIQDAHTGMRVFRKADLNRMQLVSGGMELASEMILKASQLQIPIIEVPVPYHPRVGISKLSTWMDGWRHLKFMILYSPLQWFLIPSAVMTVTGLAILLLLLDGPATILGATFYLHPMFLGSFLVLLGYQLAFLGVISQLYGVTTRLILTEPPLLARIREQFKLETGLIAGLILSLIGLTGLLYIVVVWWQAGFQNIFEVRLSLFSVTLLMLGIQTIFSSVVLSIFTIPAKN
jgi:glycosyltransferase involved in cell wall biosynthesis